MDAFDWNSALASRAEGMRASEVRELLKLLQQPDILSFAGGIPDPALFPRERLEEACVHELSTEEGAAYALQYSVSEGFPPLREWLVQYMLRKGIQCSLDNIIITSGSQQALDLIAKLLVSADDTVLVTAPTYLGALQAFAPYQPRFDTIDPAALPSAAAYAQSNVRLAYVVPDFANPNGHTIPTEERVRLVKLTRDMKVPLIEDAAYEALRYEGAEERSCLAIDVAARGHIDRSHVLYCGTFSKTISPGLRLGWVCASKEIVNKLVLAKQAADLHTASLNQVILHRVVTASYESQVRRNVETYRARRDAMLAALGKHMPAAVSWTRPAGGMFVWVTLPDHLDAALLLKESLATERVAFVPGGAFFADRSGRNTLRLNFSYQPPASIDEGMRRLGGLIKRQAVTSMPELEMAV